MKEGIGSYIFNGKTISVLDATNDTDGLVVVTFTGRDHSPPAKRGAAAEFFLKNKVNAVHFISKQNHWWCTPEFIPAVLTAREWLSMRGFTQVVTYGSSMGGHGALRSAKWLAADRIVAFVPQFSINPDVVPWETRWRKDSKRIDFKYEEGMEYLSKKEVIAFSDPLFRSDQKHIDTIAVHASLMHIPVTFSLHDSSRILQDVGILGRFTLLAVHGNIDVKQFREVYRSKRSESALAYGGAAVLTGERSKGCAVDLATKAVTLLLTTPPAQIRAEHIRLSANLARQLIRSERYDLAESLLMHVKSSGASMPADGLYHLALVSEKKKDLSAALEYAVLCLESDRRHVGALELTLGILSSQDDSHHAEILIKRLLGALRKNSEATSKVIESISDVRVQKC